MFITFEGPDGCGKTTQIALLSTYLTQQGFEIVVTREPGGTDIGERLRHFLHDHENENIQARTEILLYSASRAQLVEEVIKPALNEGKIVISDRFFDSTFAYQGYGRSLDLGSLTAITKFATGGLRPDLTLYIKLSAEEGLARRKADKDAEWNRLDAESIAFHDRVHAGYQALIAQEPDRWIVIEGSGAVEDVQARIQAAVMDRLKQPG